MVPRADYKRILKTLLKVAVITFKVIVCTVVGLLILYSAAFSIGGTYVIYKTYHYLSAPIKEVKAFENSNPVHTKFMERCIKELETDTLLPDTLLHTFVPLDSISPHLVNAVLAAEDDGFYLHPGIDIASVLAAAEYNKTKGKNSHGASTLTQQMAKNLFLSDERSFDRKIKELVYAVLMERYLGKDRILELYLNYAQWGRNIFGCEAAAQFYFKKSAQKLTLRESVRMAAVLAKPSKITPHHTRSVFMGKRIGVIAQNLYLHHTISDTDFFDMTGAIPPQKPVKDTASAEKKRSTPDKIDKRTSF